MANATTYPSDGRLTTLQTFPGTALVGTELMEVVSPGNASLGVNYQITANALSSALIGPLLAAPIIINANVTTSLPNTQRTGDLLRLVQADATVARIEINSFGGFCALTGLRADGTAGGVSALIATDLIFAANFGGYNGTAYIITAALEFTATQNWNATSAGTNCFIVTCPNGTTVPINVVYFQNGMALGTSTDPGLGNFIQTGNHALLSGVALNSVATAAVLVSSVPAFGMYCGTGVPSVAAATGSFYLRNDGSSATTRMYINQNGSTTWTAVMTLA